MTSLQLLQDFGFVLADFCAQVKQILSEVDLKENYRRTVPVDLSFAKNFISDGVGSKWAEEVTKF